MTLLALGIIFATMMSIFGIYALATTSTTASNTISTDAVNIEVSEYSIDSQGNEVEYVELSKVVMPGEVISLIPKVKNLGMDCYIRVKLNIITDEGIIDASDSIVNILSDFKKYGEYYYYEPVVKSNEVLKVFDSFKIPNDLPYETQGKEIKLNIVVEAIQSVNFKPDYTKSNPWQGVEIVECIDTTFKMDGTNTSTKVEITYENSAQQYIKVPDDFLSNLQTVAPGDKFEQSIKISNVSDKSVEYLYEISTKEELTEREKSLLKNIKLIITNSKGSEIYNGNLYVEDLVSLGTYEKSTTDDLKFTIIVPKKLNNDFSILNIKLNWNFKIKSIKSDNDVNSDKAANPKTGDSIGTSFILFFMSAIGLVISLILLNRENKKEEKN